MITIEYTRNGETGSKKVHTWALESTLANFRRAGYTIISDGTAPAPVAEIPAAEVTGRVGKGREVHRIIAGGAHCGSSYRKGLNANIPVYVTGEQMTCSKCLAH